jgi:phage replication O-like protein O
MANPQLEDGRTEIANELVDALCRTYFMPAESKLIWTIFRKTYGWHKKSDAISYTQFEKSTGLDKRHVGPALKRLINRNIVFCSNAGERHISEYGIQKDYEKWLLTPKTVTKSDTNIGNKLAPKQVTGFQQHLTPISVNADTDLGHADTDLSVTTDTDLSNDKSNKAIYKSNIQKQCPKPFQTPEWIKKETWDAFLVVRKSLKAKPTDHALTLIVQALDRLRAAGDDPNEILDQSIMNNWKGVFALKNKQGGSHAAHRQDSQFPRKYTSPEEFFKGRDNDTRK